MACFRMSCVCSTRDGRRKLALIWAWGIVAVCLAPSCTIARDQDFTLYSTTHVSGGSSIPNTLIAVDPLTGNQYRRGPVSEVHEQHTLDAHPRTGVIYGTDPFTDGLRTTLWQIDVGAGTASEYLSVHGSQPISQVTNIAFSPNGTLYGVVTPGHYLGTIDLGSGQFTQLSQIDFPSGHGWGLLRGMDFSPSGVLYGVLGFEDHTQLLATISPIMGTVSTKPLPAGADVGEIDFAPDGYIYATNYSWLLLRVDPITAGVSWQGSGHLGALGGLASTFYSPGYQRICLALDKDLPVLIKRSVDIIGRVRYRTKKGSMPHASLTTTAKSDILQRVARMFSDSGVTNIEFVDSPDDATVVYLAQTPDVSGWTLLGKAYSGVDRWNRDPDGAVAVFVTGDNELDAEVIAHEVGHTVGLRHVNPPSSSDPLNQSIMDYDSVPGDRERFIDGRFEITEPPNDPSGGTGQFHNPVYHLRSYVDGLPQQELPGLLAGGWDLGSPAPGSLPSGSFEMTFSFAENDKILYDVFLSVGVSDDTMETLYHFDEITLAELATLEISVEVDEFLELIGASESGGVLDTVLSDGDPYVLENTLMAPTEGQVELFLQTYTDPVVGAFQAFSKTTVVSVAVPEPSTFILVSVGALSLLGYASRRQRRGGTGRSFVRARWCR